MENYKITVVTTAGFLLTEDQFDDREAAFEEFQLCVDGCEDVEIIEETTNFLHYRGACGGRLVDIKMSCN